MELPSTKGSLSVPSTNILWRWLSPCRSQQQPEGMEQVKGMPWVNSLCAQWAHNPSTCTRPGGSSLKHAPISFLNHVWVFVAVCMAPAQPSGRFLWLRPAGGNRLLLQTRCSLWADTPPYPAHPPSASEGSTPPGARSQPCAQPSLLTGPEAASSPRMAEAGQWPSTATDTPAKPGAGGQILPLGLFRGFCFLNRELRTNWESKAKGSRAGDHEVKGLRWRVNVEAGRWWGLGQRVRRCREQVARRRGRSGDDTHRWEDRLRAEEELGLGQLLPCLQPPGSGQSPAPSLPEPRASSPSQAAEFSGLGPPEAKPPRQGLFSLVLSAALK